MQMMLTPLLFIGIFYTSKAQHVTSTAANSNSGACLETADVPTCAVWEDADDVDTRCLTKQIVAADIRSTWLLTCVLMQKQSATLLPTCAVREDADDVDAVALPERQEALLTAAAGSSSRQQAAAAAAGTRH
jgi:hypothetical protein